jgi:hypothetical protein
MIQGVGAGGNADDGEEPMVDTRDVTVPVDTRDVMGVPVGTRDVTVPVDTVVVAGAPRTPIAAAAMKAKRLNCMMAIRLNWVDELSLWMLFTSSTVLYRETVWGRHGAATGNDDRRSQFSCGKSLCSFSAVQVESWSGHSRPCVMSDLC